MGVEVGLAERGEGCPLAKVCGDVSTLRDILALGDALLIAGAAEEEAATGELAF